jgi:hypothetical protein
MLGNLAPLFLVYKIIIKTENTKIKNKKDKSFKKKLKHEPCLKKLGDFTVSEGHKYPLV